MNNPILDPGIPVLTQVVTVPARPASPVKIGAEIEQQQPQGKSNESRDARRRLENELSVRILSKVQARMDLMLEQCVRDSLGAALQSAGDRLAADLKQTLQHTLAQEVGQAVAEELAKLRIDKTKNPG